MKKLLCLILLLFLKNAPAQEKMVLTSDLIPHADTTLVFFPSDYNDKDSYPLVFMLHGYSGNYKQWDNVTGGLQKVADQYKFIIACPDGFYDSWYVNSPVNKNSQFESFFFNKLVPEIFSKYSINKSNIFITGLSMGGHGAMLLMLNHPEFFKSAASTSGILDITRFPDKWNMSRSLGQFTDLPQNWKSNSAYFLLEKIKALNKEILFDCGTEDFAYGVNSAFAQRCLELKIKATFISRPGAHTRDYWKNSIDDHFRFFRRLSAINQGM